VRTRVPYTTYIRTPPHNPHQRCGLDYSCQCHGRQNWKPRGALYFIVGRDKQPGGSSSHGGCKRKWHKPIDIRESIAVRRNCLGMYRGILRGYVSEEKVGVSMK
jgi:hypothetical protein